ncbi:MAG TPA: 2-C-methyl-D-erythritol 2,4-cyclodiphosphate synthase [Puia sp.]|nr:2-C-methyl-D-erythritol 2,4-cyclodiphosphate synthase [Puia sp.]
MSFRIGNGMDFHQLEEGRKFWLGGVEIPFHKGAVGHSDADVLLHAICDALLGALNLGDIGIHFPDTDAACKDIDSKILLEKTFALVRNKNYRIVNIDSTVCLQEPKISPYTKEMRRIIASILEVSVDDISIKATTTEHMGFVGRGEGIVAYASALVESRSAKRP